MRLVLQLIIYSLIVIIPLKAQQYTCIDFDDLTLNTQFGRSNNNEPGDLFLEAQQVKVTGEEFLYANGSTDFIDVTVYDESVITTNPIGAGNVLFVSNINLKFDFRAFGAPVESVCIDFWDGGGHENLSINGEELRVWEFSEQIPEGEISPGVQATFTPVNDNPNNNLLAGTLCLTGKIEELIIGGQEFVMDNFCFTPSVNTICNIRDFVVKPQPCTADGVYYADFNFVIDDITGLEAGYSIFLNNELLGDFNYEQDFTQVGPLEGGGNEPLVFTIVDKTFPECKDRFEMEPVDCNSECRISDLKASIVDCNIDGTYIMELDFEYDRSVVGEDEVFSLYINEELFEVFSYRSLPLRLDQIRWVAGTPGVSVKVCENSTTSPRCCLSDLLGIPACYPGECISFESFEASIYNEENGFKPGDVIYTQDEEKVVVRLAEFQEFDWFSTFGTLTIMEDVNADFFPTANGAFLGFEEIATVFNLSEYDPPAETITFDFAYGAGAINLAVNGGEIIILNGLETGEFALSNNVTINIEYNSAIANVGKATLKGAVYSFFIGGSNFYLDNFCIQLNDDCPIETVQVKPTECNDEGQFYVELDARLNNQVGQFSLWLNGNETGQVYKYSDLPIKLGPFYSPVSQELIFDLYDVNNPDCAGRAVLEPFNCNERCSISDIQIVRLDCDDTGRYKAEVNFKYQGTGGQFQIKTETGFEGIFAYTDLPIVIEGLAPASGMDVLAICDLSNDSQECCSSLEFKVDCGQQSCDIDDIVARPRPCNDDGTFNVVLDFKYDGDVSNSFFLEINDEQYGQFRYEQLPVEIGPLDAATGDVLKFKVVDANELCYNYTTLESPNCNPDDCIIQNVKVEAGDCDSEGYFNAVLSFEVLNPNSLGFYVFVDGELNGPYDYTRNNQLSFGPLIGDGSTVYDFLILDILDPRCFGYAELGPIDCDQPACSIRDLVVKPEECTGDGYYTAIIDFIYENPQNEFFDVIDANGDIIGYYPLADLPVRVKLPYTNSSTRGRLFVCINDNPNCCQDANFEVPNCGGNCEINGLEVSAGECRDNGTYPLKVNFRWGNDQEQKFNLFVRDGELLGTFSTSDLPLTIEAFKPSGRADDYLKVCLLDPNGDECCDAIEWESPDCNNENCQIKVEWLEYQPCEDGKYYIHLAVRGEDPNSEGYLVLQGRRELGKFRYSDNFAEIGPFESGLGEVELTLVDLNDENCRINYVFEAQNCDCGIRDLTVKPIECVGEGYYSIEVNFFHDGANNELFDVYNRAGEILGTYSLDDLPIKINRFKSSNEGVDFLKVCINDHPYCCEETRWEAPICGNPCGLTDLEVSVGQCNEDGTYQLKLNFELPTDQVQPFNLYVRDGELIGTYTTDQLPLSLDAFKPSGRDYDYLKVCLITTSNTEECCKEIEFKPADCNGGDCELKVAVVEPHKCEDGNFYIDVEIKASNPASDGFRVISDNQILGEFRYSDPYITLGPFPANTDRPIPLLFQDLRDENCAVKYELDPIDCDCSIRDLTVKPIECVAEGYYSLEINFFYDGATNELFDVINNDGEIIATFPLADLPVKLERFKASGNELDNLAICINDNPDCCEKTRWEAPNCGGGCAINDLEVSVGRCNDDGTYQLKLNFELPTDQVQRFNVFVRDGELLGTYSTEQLPLNIEDFKPSGREYDYLKICLVNNTDAEECCKEIEFKPADCNGGNCELKVAVVEPHKCEDGNFYVDVEIKASNPVSEGFLVISDGQVLGEFLYADPYITLGPFPANTDRPIPLLFQDFSDENCAVKYELDPIDCDCSIRDLTVKPIECVAEGYYSLEINFFHDGATNELFDVIHNDGTIIGTYSLADLPLKLERFKASGNEFDNLGICINDNPDCCEKTRWEALNCSRNCEINNLEVSVGACNDDGTYQLKLNFELPTDQVQRFNVFVRDGESIGTYSTDQLPLTIEAFKPSGREYDYLKVCLVNTQDFVNDCCEEIEFKPADCDGGNCELKVAVVEPYGCDNGNFYIDVEVEVANPASDGFIVIADDQVLGQFLYSAPYITLGPFPANTDRNIPLVFQDFREESCAVKYDLEPFDCECIIRDLKVEPVECVGEDYYSLEIGFFYDGGDDELFDVIDSNGEVIGTFPVADLPVTIEKFEGSGRASDWVAVCIKDRDNCCARREFAAPDCTPNPCGLRVEAIEPNVCEGDSFSVDIEVRSDNTESGFFEVLDENGESYGTFSYDETFITVGPLRGDGVTVYTFIIIDADNPDCGRVKKTFGPIDCTNEEVWPGDANADNIAQHYDILNIGLAFGSEGPAREATSIAWRNKAAKDWEQTFADGLNFKHSDCNGDGIVDEKDIEAVHQNYGFKHGAIEAFDALPTTTFDPPIFVDFESINELSVNTPFQIPIVLGTEDEPVDDIYGVAFTISFDGAVIDPESVEIEFPITWFGDPNVNVINISKKVISDSKIEIAISRIDQNNVSGYGAIAYLRGIIADIAGYREESSVEIDQVLGIEKDGRRVPLVGLPQMFEISHEQQEVGKHNLLRNLNIYPNPTDRVVNITNSYAMPIHRVELLNTDGALISQLSVNGNQVALGSTVPRGVYILKIHIGEYTVHKRIVKVNE